MATRSRIGIELSNGDVLSVYHHWDGYPTWLGVQLRKFYNTTEKVSELIDGGDMSVCLSEDGEPAPQYYSQHGEDCPPRVDTLKEYCTNKETCEEYHYLWSQKYSSWVCRDMNQFQDAKPEFVDIPV